MSDFVQAGSLVKGFLARVKARQEFDAANDVHVLRDPLCPSRDATLTRAWNAALEEDHARELQRERAVALARQEASIPERLRELGVPDTTIRALAEWTDTPTWKQAQKFVESDAQILALLGTVGTGKTVAAARVLAWGLRKGLECHFLRASTLARLSGYDDRTLFDRLCWAPVVVLDDLGTEHLHGFAKSLFHEWLDCRYSRADSKTVITANLQVEEFKTRIGERAVDRIREVGQVHIGKGASLRKRETQ